MYVPDNYDLFLQHQARQDRQLEKLPVCDCCLEPIQDEHYYDLGGELFCKDCLDNEYRKDTEDYVGRG